MPKPKSASVSTPSSSGPRWTIVAHIARTMRSSTERPPRAYQPAIPHTLEAFAFRLGRRGGARRTRPRHGPNPHAAVGADRGEARAVGGERQVLHGGSLVRRPIRHGAAAAGPEHTRTPAERG